MTGWVCVSMNGSAISGNSKILCRNDTAAQGRKDSHLIEELLERCLIIKGDVPVVHQPFSDLFRDFWTAFLSFLFSAIWFLWFCAVPGGGKELVSPINVGIRGIPKPVNKVIIGTAWRHPYQRNGVFAREPIVLSADGLFQTGRNVLSFR